MIDTLHLMFESGQFEVVPDHRLKIKRDWLHLYNKRMSTEKVLWMQDGQPRVGTKAHRKHGPFYVVIKSTSRNYSKVACSLYFSVPKAVQGDNVYPVGIEATKHALTVAQNFLDDTGIKADVRRAKVTRIDLFKNVETSEQVSSYWPIFEWNLMRRRKTQSYDTSGFVHRNGSMQLGIYDKIKQRQKSGQSVSELPLNLMRFELRFIKAQKVKAVFGTSILGELIEHYEVLETVFKNHLYNQQFKFEFSGPAPSLIVAMNAHSSQEVLSQPNLELIKSLFGKKWFKVWKETHLWSSISEAQRQTLIDNLGSNSSAISRAKKHMWEAKFASTLLLQAEGTHKPLALLYEELRDKLIGDFRPTLKKRRKSGLKELPN